eukprot:GAHX01000962.1.p1 GENE.GAHX01000962.1~~GAHX01000962.1.p1  ORF type:complete len:270 (+),score=50.96 GAHX01000962.1:410-1219(+)
MASAILNRLGHFFYIRFTLEADMFEYANSEIKVVKTLSDDWHNNEFEELFKTVLSRSAPDKSVYDFITSSVKLVNPGTPGTIQTLIMQHPFLNALYFNCNAGITLNNLLRALYHKFEHKVLFKRLMFLTGIMWGYVKDFCSSAQVYKSKLKLLGEQSYRNEKNTLILGAHLNKMADTISTFVIYMLLKENFKIFEKKASLKLKDMAGKVKNDADGEKELNVLIGRIYQLFEVLDINNSGIHDFPFFQIFKEIADDMKTYTESMEVKLSK